jgi:hypothetical protein
VGGYEKTPAGKYPFILSFGRSVKEAEPLIKITVESLEGDAYAWFCYPKGSSKKFKSDLNRNVLAELFAPYNFEPVTQVAIDEDWSAMRFRFADNIKILKRKTAFSMKGKDRISPK